MTRGSSDVIVVSCPTCGESCKPVNRDQLEHAIRAACDVAGDTELLVFGSQAILAEHPDASTVAVSHPVGTRGKVGHCVETHDLAASKLAAYRDRDREFVTTLLVERLIDRDTLLARVRTLPLEPDRIARLEEWVRRTAGELA